METSTEHDSFRQLCKEHGLKCTIQREAVYNYLKEHMTHPTVNEIWDDVRQNIPSITRESVFRILCEFTDLGLIHRLDKVIDARFDGNLSDHGHAICDRCGCIIDIPLPAGMPIPETLPNFQVRHTEFRVSGLCAKCAAALENQNKGEHHGTERK